MTWTDCLPYLQTAWCLTALLMLIFWLVQVRTKNASYIDLGWTLGLAMCALFYLVRAPGFGLRKVLLALLVCLWAARLGALLVHRLKTDQAEDKRYHAIREQWKTHQNLKFFLMFQFQGLLDVVLSWPFLLICSNADEWPSLLEMAGVVLWLIGFAGEHRADMQLAVFKKDPANKGKTCDRGLWHYSRHPNYFFEWLMWAGYFVFALPMPLGWSAAVAPLLMLHFLLNVSGVPLAEQQALKTRGEEYRRYQQSTSMFIPWFKRKI